ncbi:MAG: NADP-binding protein [Candidatus Muiribacterium halophilum]|uniref:NADP-binding protein n=1 Tax=Muiribacterium halophilum TaxID=2053465 RepID=A0A2N5ZF20_MUIH1|nr:MAG: NADP-binding protein [Candidatus Muirbacterium halophilum]
MAAVKVLQWGFGAMGSGMAKLVLEKKTLELCGVVDMREDYIGKDAGDILKREKTGAMIYNNFEEAVEKTSPDLVILATGSFTKEVYPDLERIINKKIDVITIAEEMAYPWAQEKELANKIDDLAKANDVTVLGTGINPGFVLDALVIMMTGVSHNIEYIEASRINDLSPFGPTVMRTQGVGTTPEEFAKGLENGDIVGHIGFPESIHMVANTLGIELDEVKQEREPIISNVYRETPYVKVEKGMVAGCRHIGYGIKDGNTVIKMIHPQQVLPELEDINTGDYIKIKGTPEINLSIKPEIPGGIGTMGMAVNMIHLVKESGSGLKTMADLPIPRMIR